MARSKLVWGPAPKKLAWGNNAKPKNPMVGAGIGQAMKAPAAPKAPFPAALPAPAPAAPAAPPAPTNAWQDSAYNSSVANLLQSRDSGAAALDVLGRRALEDRDTTLGALGEGRVKAKTATTQSANKQGLFNSGFLGKSLGDVDTSFGRQETDVNAAFARGEQDRAAQRASLTDAFNRGNTDAAGSAWDRYVAAAAASEPATTPGLEALIAGLGQSLAPAPAAAIKAPAKKPAAKTKKKAR